MGKKIILRFHKSFYVIIIIFLIGRCNEESNINNTPTPEPHVQIISPANNSVVFDTTIIKVRATDDHKINRVEIYINHELNDRIYTDEPFEYRWITNSLLDSSQHIIYAKAYDDEGNVTTSSVVTVLHLSFGAPFITNFFQIDQTQIVIEWWDNSTGENSFKIERQTDDGAFSEIGEAPQNTTSYQDNNLDTSKTYSYRIRASRDSHYSQYSNVLIIAHLIEGLKIQSFNYNSNILDGKFNSSGNLCAGGGAYNGIMIWDVESGNLIRHIRDSNTHMVSSLDFNPESLTILDGELNGAMRLWNINTGALLRTYTGHSQSINSLQISSSGQYIVSASSDGFIKLWYYNDEVPMFTLVHAHSASINYVTFSPDENYFLSSGDDNRVILWGFPTWNIINEYVGYLANISPDGKQLCVVTDNQVDILDFNTSTLILSIVSNEPKTSIQFSPNNQLLAFTSDYHIIVYSLIENRLIGKFYGTTSPVSSLSFSKNGNLLLSSGRLDNTIYIWDITKFKWLEL